MHNRLAPTLGLFLALAALSACGDTTSVTPVAAPVAEAGDGAIGDGTHSAYLTGIDGELVTLDFVEILTGAEAVEAAVADGDAAAADGLPNDVYVRPIDRDPQQQAFYIIEVDDDAAVELYDCSSTCQQLPVDRGDFLDGSVRPYGGDRPLVTVDISDGRITAITEQYLP